MVVLLAERVSVILTHTVLEVLVPLTKTFPCTDALSGVLGVLGECWTHDQDLDFDYDTYSYTHTYSCTLKPLETYAEYWIQRFAMDKLAFSSGQFWSSRSGVGFSPCLRGE